MKGEGRLEARSRLPILGFPLLAVGLFSSALFGDRVFWQRDIHLYWYAQAESFVRVIAQGSWPLWNPFVSFGLPMLADPSYQILYPFTWLNLVMLPATYYKLYVFVHTVAAGLGLYLLSRRWTLSRRASFVAGAAWMSSGPLLVVVSHTHHFAGTAWIPWVLLALEAALASPTLGAALVLGAVAAGQVFAGSGDLCLMTGSMAAGRGVLFLCTGGTDWRRRSRSLLVVTAVATTFAALLSAAQWLPTATILRSGQRLEMASATNMYWSLHPASLPDLFVFRLVSDFPISTALRAALYESREPLFACIYVGAGALVLVSFGLLQAWSPLKGFATVGLGLSLLLALGRNTAIYPALLGVSPLAFFRYPSKYLIAAGFFWAVLVGLAAEDWLASSGPRTARRGWLVLAVVASVAGLFLATAGWLALNPAAVQGFLDSSSAASSAAPAAQQASAKLLRSGLLAATAGVLIWLRLVRDGPAPWLGGALLLLVVGDLAAHGRQVNPLAPSELLAVRPQTARHVAPGSRVYCAQSKPREWFTRRVTRGPLGWEWQWAWALGMRELVWPPTGARWGLAGSYDGDFTGLAPPLLSNLTLILGQAYGSPLGIRILQMGGVDHVVTLQPWPGLLPQAEFQSVFDTPVRLLGVPGTLPRAYLVGVARLASEPDSVSLIGDAGFDPEREVILPRGTALPRLDLGFQGSLRELWRRADGIGFATDASAPAYVVELGTFYPGWRATVDGSAAEVLRANLLFRAVAVPAGRHLVTMVYRPRAVTYGLLVSLASLCGGVGYGLQARRRASWRNG